MIELLLDDDEYDPFEPTFFVDLHLSTGKHICGEVYVSLDSRDWDYDNDADADESEELLNLIYDSDAYKNAVEQAKKAKR